MWTGGKDCTLALLAARERQSIACLVTFVPDPPRPFLAHPLELIRAQARALGLEHRALPVAAPLDRAYEDAIDALVSDGVDALVTGDMDRVDGHENWIVERARGRVRVERPLWQADRAAALRRLEALGVEAVCTLSRRDRFDAPFAGTRLTPEVVERLVARHGQDGFDACGENGEYHTCVLNAPGFAAPLVLQGAEVVESGDFDRLALGSVGRQ
ncbi:MAG: hypothetical protein AAGB93_02925 [Planctomycetota bacterium]